MVEDVGDDLKIRLHLRIGAGRPTHEDQIAIPRNHHRVHRVPHALAGRETVHVLGIEMPVGHPIVQEDPRPGADQPRTEARLNALKLANGISAPIDDREARRVLPTIAGSLPAPRGFETSRISRHDRRSGAPRVDQRGPGPGIFL